MTKVTLPHAKAHLSSLIDHALAGEEIVIAKAGRARVRLIPVESRRKRQPGLAKGRLTEAFFDLLPPEEIAGWENPR